MKHNYPKRKSKYSKEDISLLVEKSYSIREVLKKLNLSPNGGHRLLRDIIKSCNISHFTGQHTNKGLSHKGGAKLKPLLEVMIKNSNYARHLLKKRLLDQKLLKNKCYLCNCLPVWKGKPLVMVLDHINDKNNDNRLENLRLLCPNCNSQTSTFCSRNKKNIKH